MKKVTILLADDHAMFRDGLRLLLEATGDMTVVGQAASGYSAVDEAKRLRPDIVLMDIALPLLNGVEAARRIARDVPDAKVFILSAYSDDQHVQQAVAAGVAGYLMKETASKDLLRAIRGACKGNLFFSPPIVRRLVKHWIHDPDCNTGAAPALTGRQTEVLKLIAQGNSSREIAGLLAVSLKTVEKHRQGAMDKLDIHEIAGLTRYAASIGIIECGPVSNGRDFRPVGIASADHPASPDTIGLASLSSLPLLEPLPV